MIQNHEIVLSVADRTVTGWISYAVELSMLRPADSFTFSAPFDRELWNLCKPDAEVRIFVDDTNILTGFIDDREKPNGADTITVAGRDRVGRLVQESAPAVSFNKQSAKALIASMASPWFESVELSNANNRNVMRGAGRKISAASEPVYLDSRHSTKTDPGQMRWQVIEDVAKQLDCFAWSSGDGKRLIVSKPNYSQPPQYSIFHPAAYTRRGREGNALAVGISDSVGDRYSKIVVIGNGQGDAANYGDTIIRRYGEAKDNPATVDGDGRDFARPKRLMLFEDARDRAECGRLAAREMARRNVAGHRVTVSMPGHGQAYADGERVTLFAVDTVAKFEDELTGLAGNYLITSVRFSASRDGDTTDLEMVPVGSEIYP